MSANNKKDWYLERLVPDELPWYHKKMYQNHAARYVFATKFVKEKMFWTLLAEQAMVR